MKIWVDDIRTPPDGYDIWAKTSDKALDILQQCEAIDERPELMSLDHDLGDEDTSRRIVLWMCVNNFWPVEVRCHSSNPPGREWIEKMIERYHGDNS